ncbi:TPA: hypothetical protein ACH3X1_010923 [Trebouxia sp. C0004]
MLQKAAGPKADQTGISWHRAYLREAARTGVHERLDILSAGNAPPATMKLLQTIRHNITARIGSMIESGMLAIVAAPQQQQQPQELSVNQ